MSLLEMQTLEPCPWTRTYIFMDDFCRKCLKGTGIATCRKSRTLVTFERKEKTLQGLWSWTYWHTQNWNYTKQLRLPCGMQPDFFSYFLPTPPPTPPPPPQWWFRSHKESVWKKLWYKMLQEMTPSTERSVKNFDISKSNAWVKW